MALIFLLLTVSEGREALFIMQDAMFFVSLLAVFAHLTRSVPNPPAFSEIIVMRRVLQTS